MIETKALSEMIQLAIASAYIKEPDGTNKSVSVLIIAKPESGKTQSMKEFSNNDGIVMPSDITYSGLIDIVTRAKEGAIKTILLPDLLKVYGRNANVSKNFFTLLNEVIEEGIKELSTYEHNIDLGKFVRVNMIGAVTENELFSQLGNWGQIGFMSRVVPFSYKYSPEQVRKIFIEIMSGKSPFVERKLKLRKPKYIPISRGLSEKINREITSELKLRFAKTTNFDIYGFRFQKNLQTLCSASAFLDRRKSVSVKDVNKMLWLSKWMNFDLNVIE